MADVVTDVLVDRARHSIREVERFAYRALSNAAEGEPELEEARIILRLAVGLRRKLDAFGENKTSKQRPPDSASRVALSASRWAVKN